MKFTIFLICFLSTLVLAAPINVALNKPVTATGSYQAPSYAVDGNFGTAWNAGSYAVQYIEINLLQAYWIDSITCSVGQLPNGNTVHQIYLDGVLAHTWSQYTSSGDLLTVNFGSLKSATTVRVTTTSSPSWIAWNEIQVFAYVPEISSLWFLLLGIFLIPKLLVVRNL